jgi:myo-inositol catabolism protein IolC
VRSKFWNPTDVKRLAVDGFRLARDRSPAVRAFGALLLDAQYSSEVIAEALRAGLIIGTPAEKAGAFPLEWSTDPFADALIRCSGSPRRRSSPERARRIRRPLRSLQTISA